MWLKIISLFYYFCNIRIFQGVFLSIVGSAAAMIFISCLGGKNDYLRPFWNALVCLLIICLLSEPYH